MMTAMSFKNMLSEGLLESEDEYISQQRRRHRRTYDESSETDEQLSISQRLAKKRQMKRLAPKIKIGRERAKKRFASRDKLQKRADRQARVQIFKRFSKGAGKKDLSYQRRGDIEKRMSTPQWKQRIKKIAKRLFKDVRKAEIERKRGKKKD